MDHASLVEGGHETGEFRVRRAGSEPAEDEGYLVSWERVCEYPAEQTGGGLN
jgi:hypothetical protein